MMGRIGGRARERKGAGARSAYWPVTSAPGGGLTRRPAQTTSRSSPSVAGAAAASPAPPSSSASPWYHQVLRPRFLAEYIATSASSTASSWAYSPPVATVVTPALTVKNERAPAPS